MVICPRKKPSREIALADALMECEPGRNEWPVYQSLVGDILEHLFTPSLVKPIPGSQIKLKQIGVTSFYLTTWIKVFGHLSVINIELIMWLLMRKTTQEK